MSRDKQIEEMAKAICSEYDCIIPCQSCAYYEYANCRDVKSAEKLYTAGYRKVSDVAEDIIRMLRAAGINEFRYPIVADIKKKYTESEETK